jgi:nicotinic acetylcholine receptor
LLLFLGLYLTAVMAMTSVSVMMTVFVLNLHYRGPKKNEIPFWLQQLLSLSLANVIRTLGKSKRSYKTREDISNKKSITDKNLNTKNYPSINGLILSYMNINEKRVKTRTTITTPDVSKLLKITFSMD